MARIEDLWGSLRREATGAQRRVDATHPLDLYADFEHPDRPGLVLFCDTCPPDAPSLEAIGIERRQRHDGSWSLRICLKEPGLLPVFAELCMDIVEFTRSGVEPRRAGGVMLSRIECWRNLMRAERAGLSNSEIRGLIGELLFLEDKLLPTLGPDDAVAAWTGPLRTAQDFRLPSGLKIEVKAIDRDADRVQINGLGQLDGGGDPLQVTVVRLQQTGRNADGAVTAGQLIDRLRSRLAEAPAALSTFNTLLGFVGYSDATGPGDVTVRMVRIDRYDVGSDFPRLTFSTVPTGIVDASYVILLPQVGVAQ